MRSLLFCFSFLFTIVSFSQEYSNKEEKRMGPVLKRSTSTIRGFDKSAMISIEKTDHPEIEGYIENALFAAGFEVVSNRVAKETVSISNPLNPRTDTIEISKSTQFRSVYVVSVNASFYNGAALGRCQDYLISFTARIVDLANDGKLVGTFKFAGNAITYVACADDVANAFVYSLLSPKKDK